MNTTMLLSYSLKPGRCISVTVPGCLLSVMQRNFHGYLHGRRSDEDPCSWIYHG